MINGGQTTANPAGWTTRNLPVITANTTVYVATSGSDASGLGTAGAPFATIQGAMACLQNYCIAGGATVTISVGSGTYNQTSTLSLYHAQSPQIQIIGTTSNSGNANAMTTANTTTLSWVGVNGVGISVPAGYTLNTLSNLFLVGGTSGAKNTSNAINLTSSSIANMSMVACQYWSVGIRLNIRAGISYGSQIWLTGNTNYGLFAQSDSFIMTASLYTSGNGSVGVCASSRSFLNVGGVNSTSDGTAFYANYGGYLYVGSYAASGYTALASPALNTLGNSNAYIST